MNHGDAVLMILTQGNDKPRFFSRNLMCPTSGLSYANPEPNNFSFNSPKGACTECNGIGSLYKVNENKIIPNPKLSIKNGGLAPQGPQKNSWIFKQIELIAQRYKFNLSDPISKIQKAAMQIILYGGKDRFSVKNKTLGVSRDYNIDFDGIANFIEYQYKTTDSRSIKRWAKEYMDKVDCPKCMGTRLKKEAQYFKINDKNITQLARMDIGELASWFEDLPNHLNKKQNAIAKEII